jgi:hypothetical protein
MKTKTEFNRRDMLKILGGSALAVGTAATVKYSLLADNNSDTDTSKAAFSQNECDVLVVGGGMAGLFAAVKAHDAGVKVILVVKGAVGRSGQTPFARGIFSYDEKETSLSKKAFLTEVAEASDGMDNPVFTKMLLDFSKERVNDLKNWGFFDSACYEKSFKAPLEQRNIMVFERVMLTHLIKSENRIAGAAGFALDEKEQLLFRAKSVILCTGASGFKPNGFPIAALTSDGDAMAYRIGAQITGKEFNDGHLTQANRPAAVYHNWKNVFDQKPQSLSQAMIRPMLGVELNVTVEKTGGPVTMGPPPGRSRHNENDKPMGPPPGEKDLASCQVILLVEHRPGCLLTKQKEYFHRMSHVYLISRDYMQPVMHWVLCNPELYTLKSEAHWQVQQYKAHRPVSLQQSLQLKHHWLSSPNKQKKK